VFCKRTIIRRNNIYIENNIVGKGNCYTKKAKEIHRNTLEFKVKFIEELKKDYT